MKLYKSICFLLLLMVCIMGCKKYEIAPLVTNPSYIRVFNNLNNQVNFLNGQQAAPFLTFLMDPKTDAAGVPGDAEIVGDYLGTRQLFSLSYPINAANSSVGNGTIGLGGQPDPPTLNPLNYEYPGNAHVLTASFINGFDLSAWAQVPSGKHRIVFVVRPQNNTGFTDLPATQRSNILLDTTVNLEKGEVYTLEVVSRDLDKNKYGLYIRQEQFIHQAFEPNKIYAGFINLSGKTPVDSKYSQDFFFPDKIKITCTYSVYNPAPSGINGTLYKNLPGYDNTYYTTLNTKMDTQMPYLTLPLLPDSAFFYQGVLLTYADIARGTTAGTLPYVTFDLFDANIPVLNPAPPPLGFMLQCSADPTTFNNYNVNTTNVKQFTPNLNLIVNSNNIYHVYSTLNIMEMVYDRVYLMQIQRGFDEVPKN